MKLGILGAGGIASTMAKTVAEMKGVEVYAVAARDLERARVFAQKYEVKKAYGSYEEMLADDEVELVYIATPHSHHYLHAKMCLEAGKHVLCEKAFTVNAEQAQKLFDLAKEKKLLITEAIWTRYMPSRKMINDIIESGVIGEVTAVTANLSYTVSHVERIRKPELAGGALLDVGVYPINFASMVLGDKVKDVKATAIFQNGVDILDSIAMVFEGDCMATLQCGAREISDRMGSIFGTRGYMQVQNINNPEKITVFDTEHKEVASYVVPEQISGYEYEVESCMKAIQEGKLECPEMPHAETIRIMKIMDDIRMDYVISGPVWEYYAGDSWKEGMIQEIREDRLCGFIGKTVIHPSQIPVVNRAYQVARNDYLDARAILNWNADSASLVAGSKTRERMNEYKTHLNWAKKTVYLSEVFGITE